MGWPSWFFGRARMEIPTLVEPVSVEQSSESWHDCDCCGDRTRVVWGWVGHGAGTVAAYFVRWVPGKLSHGASVTLVVGAWGEGAAADVRRVAEIAVEWRDGRAGFMIVDADVERYRDLAAAAFRREELVGTELARRLFAICDVFWVRDPRLAELCGA